MDQASHALCYICFLFRSYQWGILVMAWSIHLEAFDNEILYPYSFSSCSQKVYMVLLAKQQPREIFETILYAEIALVWLTSFLQITIFCFAGQLIRNAQRF